MDGYVPLVVMEGTIIFCYGECGIVLNLSQTSDSRLFIDVVEDLVDGKLEVKCFVGLKVWSRLREKIGSAYLL